MLCLIQTTQREDEIQGLKMRLRFREAAIKRLESVASGKISAEIHLLKEKEEQLKEIEVLRNQVDRNQEVTRFAMENLRLKEEIRGYVIYLLVIVECTFSFLFLNVLIILVTEKQNVYSYIRQGYVLLHWFDNSYLLVM